ncbi:MAG: TIGR01777 family protein [Bacteroidetes bacterium]|nr:MAG: TIGR01777 family protein [Bacteroidota bacterium]
MMENVLITGGTGLVGTALTKVLQEKGYSVSYLSRSTKNIPENVRVFYWNIDQQIIDENAIAQADYIIHLAGANVAESRWTDARKREILESRTLSTELLVNELEKGNHHVKAFVGASAIGIYGLDTKDRWVSEDCPTANDFLAQVVEFWENESDQIQKLNIRLVKLRIGVVLSEKGGALTKIALPIRFWLGASLGTGEQFLSWIHLQDLCNLFVFAPNPVSNKEMTKKIAHVLKKPLFLPNVPAWFLKIVLGEMSAIVLGGNRVSCEKIQREGFKMKFENLENALIDLLK